MPSGFGINEDISPNDCLRFRGGWLEMGKVLSDLNIGIVGVVGIVNDLKQHDYKALSLNAIFIMVNEIEITRTDFIRNIPCCLRAIGETTS